ncbi:hypothetical protein [Nocardia transvalensis]|uniref:hypothetical protein n=1 Tax=Nocardia transvalensis TaxID=37333 RepID=UPI00189504F4|nr:hypothetical protein [Nocardia transvalensis]MBF6329912.1 hypothetical protein [Nocardia transvalensis]
MDEVRLVRRAQPLVKQMAWSQGLARVLIGTSMFAAPALVAGSWTGEADTATVRLPMRALGLRDAVIGIGTLWSLRRRQPVRHWFVLGVAVELVDASVTLNKRRRLGATGHPDAWELLTAAGLAGGVIVAAALRD